MTSNPVHGIDALVRGARLIARRELRPFILVPLLINLLLFIIISGIMISQLGGLTDYLSSLLTHTPVNTENMSWWEAIIAKGAAWTASIFRWLAWIIALLVLFLFFLIYGYLFGIITNIIAAPFNGILAEKVEEFLTGKAPPAEPLTQMIWRTLGRELRKLGYFILWGLIVFLIATVTSWTIIIPALLTALWGAWCMAIQYVDYPLDNHQRPFYELKGILRRRKLTSLAFGGTVMLANMVPILNIFVMPAAVAGGTTLWIERLRREGDPGTEGFPV